MRTSAQYVKDLNEIHSGSIVLLDEFEAGRVKLRHLCRKCDHVWEPFTENLMRGSACPKCRYSNLSDRFRKTEAQYKSELKKLNLSVTLIGAYNGSQKIALHRCDSCEHEWKTKPTNVLSGQGCPSCANARRTKTQTKTHDQYVKEVFATHGNKIRVIGDYVTARIKILHECTNCRKQWNVIPDSILRGHGCLSCSLVGMKEYKVGKRIFHVQGFEPQALDWIFSNTKVKPKDIVVASSGNVPDIAYEYEGKMCKHRPDIFIPRLNRIVEVKSSITFGLKKSNLYQSPKSLFRRNCAKARAALTQGIDYRLFLMARNGERIKLPKDWFLMKRKDLKQILHGKF